MGVRDVAVSVEASQRCRPLRLVRAGGTAVALAFLSSLPGTLAVDGSRDRLDAA